MAMMRALLLRKSLSSSPLFHDTTIRSCLLNMDCSAWLYCQLSSPNSYHSSAKFDLTDLTQPHLWYPNARKKKRNVFLHMGPTNSGKTYHALKRLEASSSGLYCGPLRLLAWEVAQRMNKAKVPCNLITGQERDEIDGAQHTSVTVEMADVSSEYQCAVIDEIQMVSCKTRGFAFTRALLGICSDELHVCGDPASVPLIQRILEVTGDNVQIQYYERLSPLVPLKVPLESFSNIKKGDCIVTFSRADIYRLKKKIEAGGKHLCSVVYGSLPPETRTKQATLFNDDRSEMDVLVASDAIGMGLNLNISRIIFSTMKKFDGESTRELTVPEIKQISGRAGRYGSKFPVGEVTCLNGKDLPLLHSSINAASPVLERAGLFPTFDLLSLYSRLNSTKAFYPVLEKFLAKAKLSSDYFISDCEEMLKVAAVVDELPLALYDKYLFCLRYHNYFAENFSKKGLVRLKEIFMPGTLQVPKTQNQLKELESIHKVLDLYVWLSYRMEESFPDREVAASQKSMCSLLIEEFLERSGGYKPFKKAQPTAQWLQNKYQKKEMQKYFPDVNVESD
ncbi:ATP-dependent RNA helicase SUPV3L1 [Carex littledalei]|uniref:RNA helicase n=1 Tax=Carex littledalei TaxID=544730 RepID=A0A833QEZ1_9POAL|nr:ATP-dependent RNA helicase SUPV3L1 [Carex littledalei]